MKTQTQYFLVILVSTFSMACAPGFQTAELGDADFASLSFSKNSNFQELLKDAPPRLQGMARGLGDALLASGEDKPEGCVLVSVAKGQSLAAAINARLKAAGETAIAICATPGKLDQTIVLGEDQSLFLFAGHFEQSATIQLNGARSGVVGAGIYATTLTQTKAGPQVLIGNFVDGYRVANMTLSRKHANLAAGDNAVRTEVSNNNGVFESLNILGQFDGLYLGVTAYSQIRDLTISNCARHGMVLTNLHGAGPTQYYAREILFAQNGGFAVYASPDSGQMSVGTWSGIYTFHNLRGGIMLASVNGNKVESLRLSNSFFGNDGLAGGGAEITIQGGTAHMISDSFFEMAGWSGLNMEQIAPGTAAIYIHPGVNLVNMSNLIIANGAGPGIYNAGTNVIVNASSFSTNGHRATRVAEKSGILNAASGTIQVVGSQFLGHSSVQAQGIYSESPIGTVKITGVNFDTSQGMIATVGVDATAVTDPTVLTYATPIKAYFDQYLPGCYTAEKEAYWAAWFKNGGTQVDFVNTLINVAATKPSCMTQ